MLSQIWGSDNFYVTVHSLLTLYKLSCNNPPSLNSLWTLYELSCNNPISLNSLWTLMEQSPLFELSMNSHATIRSLRTLYQLWSNNPLSLNSLNYHATIRSHWTLYELSCNNALSLNSISTLMQQSALWKSFYQLYPRYVKILPHYRISSPRWFMLVLSISLENVVACSTSTCATNDMIRVLHGGYSYCSGLWHIEVRVEADLPLEGPYALNKHTPSYNVEDFSPEIFKSVILWQTFILRPVTDVTAQVALCSTWSGYSAKEYEAILL
jgi:NADPH-dependent 7-cyano-7-deazaguanine reductase QueF-like protein